jgi:hypothetical protein
MSDLRFTAALPVLIIDDLPEKEKPHARVIAWHLNFLVTALRQFYDALQLLDMCNQEHDHIGWGLMAGRDGAMTLYHIWHSLRAIKSNVEKGKAVLRKGVEIAKIDGAIVLLNTAVPDIEGLRHSVSHTAEMFNSPSRWEGHKSKPFQTRLFKHEKHDDDNLWLNCMDGRTFFTTESSRPSTGNVVEYELSDETFIMLEDVFVRVLSAFPASRLRLLLPS